MTALIWIVVALSLLLAGHQTQRARSWRDMYLHEQALRRESQENFDKADELLSDYAFALAKRDLMLESASKHLQAQRLGLMASVAQMPRA